MPISSNPSIKEIDDRLAEIRAAKRDQKSGRNPIVDKINAPGSNINKVIENDPIAKNGALQGAMIDPTANEDLTIDQIDKRLAEIRAQKAAKTTSLPSKDQPIAEKDTNQKTWYEKVLDVGKEIAPFTPQGIIAGAPGQIMDLYNQGKGIYEESKTPGEVPSTVSGIRSAINSFTLGQAPNIAAGIEAPFSEKTFPELQKQYKDYYQKSATERPLASGFGANVGSGLLMNTLGEVIPGAQISKNPANLLDILKIGWDVARGGVIGEASGIGATYGVAPDENIRLQDRAMTALPSAAMGIASTAGPRVGSMFGRNRANKSYVESINEPRVAAFESQKKEIETANLAEKQRYELEQGKIPEKKEQAKAIAEFKKTKSLQDIGSQVDMVQKNRIKAWDDLMQDPKVKESTVNLDNFWKEATKKYDEIKSKSTSNMTQDESNYIRQYENWKNDYTKRYGATQPHSLSPEGAYIIGEKRPKTLQTKEIPFNEAIGMNKVINEEYGKEGFSSILSTLKNDLNKSIEESGNKVLSQKFKAANSLYGYEKDLNRAYSQIEKKSVKGEPVPPVRKKQLQPMPESPALEVAPKPEVPLSVQAITDMVSPNESGNGLAQTLKHLIEQIYYPSLTPTAGQQFFDKRGPYLNLLGNAVTSYLGSGLKRPTLPGDQI